MSTQAQPATETPPASPAREATNTETPADNAQVSGPVVAATTKKSKQPKPQRTPKQKAYDEAKAAHERTGNTLEEARLGMEAEDRQKQFDAGMRAIHTVLLADDPENRTKTLGAFMDAADSLGKQAIIDYQNALETEAKLTAEAAAKKQSQ